MLHSGSESCIQGSPTEYAQWYDPKSWQSQSAYLFVRFESHRFYYYKYTYSVVLCDDLSSVDIAFVLIRRCLIGPSPQISWMAPFHLSLATSLSSPICTFIKSYSLRWAIILLINSTLSRDVFPFVHCIVAVSGISLSIGSVAPSLLSLATSLRWRRCALRIASFSLTILLSAWRSIRSWFQFRSRRYLDSNQLSGTIPPQLGNLTQLKGMYAVSELYFFPIFTIANQSLIAISLSCRIPSCSITRLSGPSTRISSWAPSLRSSATLRGSLHCTLRIVSRYSVLYDPLRFSATLGARGLRGPFTSVS